MEKITPHCTLKSRDTKTLFVGAATSSPSSDLVLELPNFLIKSNEKILFDNFFFKVENLYNILCIILLIDFIFKIVDDLLLNI